MKRLFSILLTVIVAMLFIPLAYAREYGEHPERTPVRYVVTKGKKLNVRAGTSSKEKLRTQLCPGDIVYFNDDAIYEGGGYQWKKITSKWDGRMASDGYVTFLDRLQPEENPLYDPPSDEKLKIENAVDSTQATAKWILLIISIIAAIVYLVAYFMEDPKEKILGVEHNGMRRTFFFNIAPYRTVILITLMLLAAALTSVVIMLLLGGAGFVLLWIVKILCYVLMWVGIIGCVIGIICCIGGQWSWIVAVIVGGLIWIYSNQITSFGDACADTGLAFFNQFNLLGYSYDLLLQYWEPVLVITCIPLVIFLGMAVLWLLTAGVLILVEKIMTSRYNIKHPCPHCHQPSEPAIYLSSGSDGYEALPNGIMLRPGMYGLFHITHPHTREKMPTMLMNGRDRLVRQCAECNRLIQANEGTERHLAIAGSAMSGKSTLTYRMIAEIFRRAGENSVSFTDVDFTVHDSSMLDKVKTISHKDRIDEDELPAKTVTDDVASTQLIIQRNRSSIPYRLFINDVAGELFDGTNAMGPYSTKYFRNVESIMLVIDPITTDLSEYNPSDEYLEWLKTNDKDNVPKLPLDTIVNTIETQLNQYVKDAGRIHLNIVFTKADLGYIPVQVQNSPEENLRAYVERYFGLGKLLYWGNKFASCNIFVVSATSPGASSNIGKLVDGVIVRQLGIKL